MDKTNKNMEQYNYIKAKVISNGKVVDVRQSEPGGRIWTDKEGDILYDLTDLDFTKNLFEFPEFMQELEKHNKEWEEQNKKHQQTMETLIQSMDVKALEEHRAKIEERAYWRKLRGEICLELMRINGNPVEVCNITNELFSNIYSQDKVFFREQ